MLEHIEKVAASIASVRYTWTCEADLQDAMSIVLTEDGIPHEREVRLDARSRIDLLTAQGLGIEIKVAGTGDQHVRQLRRYAAHDRVRGLLLVTTRRTPTMPGVMHGIPVHALSLMGGGL